MARTVTSASRLTAHTPTPVIERAHRDVVVAVQDADADRGVTQWAIDATDERDHLHVVHAYKPFALIDCNWEAARNARAYRKIEAHRVVAQAQCPIRARHITDVDGSVVPGDAADVLIEISNVADVIVVGADEPTRGEAGVARRLRADTRCVVVTVPRDYERTAAPVTALLTHTGSDDRVLAFARREAARAVAPMRVVELPPGETGEILRTALTTSQLVVVASTTELTAILIQPGLCPTAVVPNDPETR